MGIPFNKISADNIIETPERHFVNGVELTKLSNLTNINIGNGVGDIPIIGTNGKLDITIIPDISGGVTSVAGRNGAVTLSVSDITDISTVYAPITNPIFNGTPTVATKGNIITESDILNGGYF
jgi:hypothetical protein